MRVAGATGLAQARASLSERLHVRRGEIEQAILTRVYGVSDTSEINDPAYTEGLRTAVSVAVVYALAAIERGDDRIPPVPPALLIQARAAARNGVSLDTVLRRYFGGYALLGDFLIEEAARGGVLEEDALKGVLRVQAALFDRLLASVSEEYAREVDGHPAGRMARLADRVRRLLDGELLDTSALGYDLDSHHVGMIATGPDALDAVRAFDSSLDCQALVVPQDEVTVWGWLGRRDGIDPSELQQVATGSRLRASIATGEPGEGLGGWRVTHEQARAALPIATRTPSRLVRYVDVAPLASMLQDRLLCDSLRQFYLEPLARERDGGTALRETLSAYFAAGRNVSSAAAALKVSRRTVANRLHAVEARLDRPLDSALPGLEAALRLDELAPVAVQPGSEHG